MYVDEIGALVGKLGQKFASMLMDDSWREGRDGKKRNEKHGRDM